MEALEELKVGSHWWTNLSQSLCLCAGVCSSISTGNSGLDLQMTFVSVNGLLGCLVVAENSVRQAESGLLTLCLPDNHNPLERKFIASFGNRKYERTNERRIDGSGWFIVSLVVKQVSRFSLSLTHSLACTHKLTEGKDRLADWPIVSVLSG